MKKFTLIATALAAGVLASASAHANIIADPSFELGDSLSSPWTLSSTNFPSPLCTTALCGTGNGTAGPRTGEWWAWFGGAGGALEEGSATQSVTLLDGGANLSFWLNHGSGDSATDFIQVRIDNTPVWTYNANGGLLGQGYTQINVDLSAFGNNAPRLLEFFSSTGPVSSANFSVDDVSVVTAPIPEPGTYGLMALGLAGLLVARRRAAQR
jgi:hypothetical protein